MHLLRQVYHSKKGTGPTTHLWCHPSKSSNFNNTVAFRDDPPRQVAPRYVSR